MSGPLPRPSFLASFIVLALLALSGCASSAYSTNYDRSAIPDYAAAEPVQGLERSTICHQGRTITIVNIAVNGHLRHGDTFGACSEDDVEQQEAPVRTEATASAQGR